MSRRALLLGIDRYEESSLILPAASQDTKQLAEALILAGFEPSRVKQVVGADATYLSTRILRKRVREFLRDAEPDDELLVYFSGHGVEWHGGRLLIPQDYDLAAPCPRHELIGDTDLFELARTSPAASVVFIIDACRERITLDVVAGKGPESADVDSPRKTPSIAMLFSCETGELSYATDEGSYFTRALCHVLASAEQTNTLLDVAAAVRRHLSSILPPGVSQHPVMGNQVSVGRGGDPSTLILKESPAARLRQQIELSAWCQRTAQSPIWETVEEASAGLAAQLQTLILRSEILYKNARTVNPEQRWGDEEAPSRLVRRLELLVGDSLESLLGPAEAAVAIAVPHVYEAILAAASIQLAENDDSEETPSTRMAGALASRVAADTGIASSHARLQARGMEEAARDLRSWQMQRFLHESGELWDYVPGGPAGTRRWVNRELDELFSPAPFSCLTEDDRILRVLEGRHLVAMARLSFKTFDDIELEQQNSDGLERDRTFGEGDTEWRLDEGKLAHLLNVAAGMTLDPRHLPAVLAEHIGRDPAISAAAVTATLAKSEWHRKQDGLALALECPHEALDAALEIHVSHIGDHLHRLSREGVLAAKDLDGLPDQLSDGGLEPTQDRGTPRYRRPHLLFSLDQGRVREMLMGKQLYGQPELALRELYQNALDACRYRQARERFERTKEAREWSDREYQGLIQFRTGIAEGRQYVECEDNGVGMGERHLRSLFAKAGRRFADSHEFHLEQADWEAENIPFYPNSRFGIGVFSYFMLADEIVVESCRLLVNGIDREPGICARVVGSGTLFRLQPLQNQCRGTRVRLYLEQADLDARELLDRITDWLWVPEFETRISGSREFRLPAGEPSTEMVSRCDGLVEIPSSVGDAGHVRLWWSERDVKQRRPTSGKLLVDGIRVAPRPAQDRDLPFDPDLEEMDRPTRIHTRSLSSYGRIGLRTDNLRESPVDSGLVVNLTEHFRPTMSVDRKEITEWNAGRTWVQEIVDADGWRQLLQIDGITATELANFHLSQPAAVAQLDRALRDNDFAAPTIPHSPNGGSIDLSRVGLSAADQYIAHMIGRSSEDNEFNWVQRAQERDVSPPPTGSRPRLRVLHDAGFELPNPWQLLAEFDGRNPARDLPVWTRSRWKSRTTTALDLSRFSHQNSLPFEDVVAALKDIDVGGHLLNTEGLPDTLTLTAQQLILASRDGDGDSPWVAAITLKRMAEAASAWSMPLTEVAVIARPLSKLGILVPDSGEIPPDLALSPRQLSLLASLPPDNVLHLSDIARASATWSMCAGDVLDLAQPLEVLGIALPSADRLKTDAVLQREHAELLSLRGLKESPETDCVPATRMFVAAAAWSWTLAEISELAKPFEDFGLTVGDLSGASEPNPLVRRLVSKDFDSSSPWVDSFSLRHLFSASRKSGKSVGELVQVALSLEPLGFEVSEIARCPADLDFEPTTLGVLSRLLNILPDSSLNISLAQLLRAAAGTGSSLMEVAEIAGSLSELGIHAESLPREIARLDANDQPLKHLRELERMIDWPQQRLDPMSLATSCVNCIRQPTDYREALPVLDSLGIDVNESIRFIESLPAG